MITTAGTTIATAASWAPPRPRASAGTATAASWAPGLVHRHRGELGTAVSWHDQGSATGSATTRHATTAAHRGEHVEVERLGDHNRDRLGDLRAAPGSA
jgi:hypothetical protein